MPNNNNSHFTPIFDYSVCCSNKGHIGVYSLGHLRTNGEPSRYVEHIVLLHSADAITLIWYTLYNFKPCLAII